MSEDAQIRRANLKALGHGPSELSVKLGSSVGYWSALLSGSKSFGEKAARSIEEKLELPRGWLDTPQGGQVPTQAMPVPVAGPVSLAQALEVLGMALAHELPDDVREDVADALARLAKRKGLARVQDDVLKLLDTQATAQAAPRKAAA